jgi:ribosomal-protein-alanine N-acetyltransferase
MISTPPGAVLAVRPMLTSDIEAVSKIEKQSFTTFWNTQAYVTELANANAVYMVATLNDRVVGYGGLWVIMDEAHITTIAVEANLRGQKIGERLLIEMLKGSQKRGATRSTLEVRETNEPARCLYQKYGYVWVAIRKAYYSDNNENAEILWIDDMTTGEWRRRFAANCAALGVSPT